MTEDIIEIEPGAERCVTRFNRWPLRIRNEGPNKAYVCMAPDGYYYPVFPHEASSYKIVMMDENVKEVFEYPERSK